MTAADHLRAAAQHVRDGLALLDTREVTCRTCGSHKHAENFRHWKIANQFKATAEKLTDAAVDLDKQTASTTSTSKE